MFEGNDVVFPYIAFKHPLIICWPLFQTCFCWTTYYYPIIVFLPQESNVSRQFEVNFKLPSNIQLHWVKYCNSVTSTTLLYWFKKSSKKYPRNMKKNWIIMLWNLLIMITTWNIRNMKENIIETCYTKLEKEHVINMKKNERKMDKNK